MFSLFLIAFVGGFLTIAAPCILAVLPIIVGSTVGQQSKLRPFFIVLGLTVSFTAFGVIFQYVTNLFGLSNNSLRNIALVFLGVFGLALIFPQIFEKILFHIQNFFNKLVPPKPSILPTEAQKKKGLLNGFFVGASLGLVWVPCAGPILGAILTIAATQGDIGKVILLMLAYSLGAGLPMLLIAYGGNLIVSRLKFLKQKGAIIQQISGVVLLFGVVLIAFGLDTQISTSLAGIFPDFNNIEQNLVDTSGINGTPKNIPTFTESQQTTSGTQSSSDAKSMIDKLLMPKGVKAPELTGTQDWINSSPLTIADLKGKVVIVDFWTYSCINCIRTLPYMNTWYQTYKDKGLVIIGVHTPEFAFEKELPNVQKAVKDFGIQYPVVQDNNYSTWQAYDNHYWPAKYIIDKEGNVRYEHFGEGNYEETEMIIQDLLNEDGGNVEVGKTTKVDAPAEDLTKIQTAETYFGYNRQEFLGNNDKYVQDKPSTFTQPTQFDNDKFYLGGQWTIGSEYITSDEASAKLSMNYMANKINLVADITDKPVTAKVYLDGKPIEKKDFGSDVQSDGTVKITKAALYNLVNTGTDYGRHTVTLEVMSPGLKAFTFTFG